MKTFFISMIITAIVIISYLLYIDQKRPQSKIGCYTIDKIISAEYVKPSQKLEAYAYKALCTFKGVI